MKKLLLLIPLLALGSCTDKKYYTTVIAPEDPCEPTVVGRTVLVIDNDEGPPTVIHGFLVDDDCDESTPPIFVSAKELKRGRGHYIGDGRGHEQHDD